MTQATELDEGKLMEFVGQAVGDVGAMLGGAMVVLGDKLDLYRAMKGAGPITAAELATSTGTAERYVREWLCAQAARGYVSYDGAGRFSLPDEHAIPLTDETSPACVIGAFETALGSVYATDTIAERFRTGEGFAWQAHDQHVLAGCERFFRPGYLNFLASTWIPALDGVEAKLAAGARVADVGCGHGASTLLMATAYPASVITGFDAHDGSISAARKRATDAGLADRVNFEVATGTTFRGTYDLVCFFDSLHDMGDPAGACAHVREHLAADGTLMLVEPFAADDVSDNLNPVGAAYTRSPRCSARPPRCRRRSAPRWVPRRGKPGSARSSPALVSPAFAEWQRRRSTSCSKQRCDAARSRDRPILRTGKSGAAGIRLLRRRRVS